MNYTFSKKIGLGLFFAVVAFFFAQIAFAQQWTAPTAQFPNNNTEAPIHVGPNAQGKDGVGFANNFINAIEMDDLFSRFSTYSQGIVGARKFCIIPTDADYAAAVDSDPTNDNCITSWGGQGGDLPAGTDTQTLRHNGTEWLANSILQNDGVTVTVKRGAGMPTQVDEDLVLPTVTTPPDGSGGGGVIDPGGTDYEETGGFSGFNYIKDLFSTNKAFAQNGSSTAPIFRAIKDISPQFGGGVLGLEVLHNGVTRAKGGFISQGDATVTGDATLQDRTVAHRITIADQGTNNVPGGVLEAWDGEFQWNGAGGEFNVGSPAQISGPLQISSGDPDSGKVLTSDTQGNTSWENADNLVSTTQSSMDIKVKYRDFDNRNNSLSCSSFGPDYVVMNGGGNCKAAGAVIQQNRPEGPYSQTGSVEFTSNTAPTSWRTTCSSGGVKMYLTCMNFSTETTPATFATSTPPTPTSEWQSAPGVSVIGDLGESCLAMTNDHVLPGLGWPSISSASDIGVGGNQNGSAPANAGECVYQQGTSGPTLDLKSAAYANSGWRPIWNTALATPFWARY